jgi:hypothetical protein
MCVYPTNLLAIAKILVSVWTVAKLVSCIACARLATLVHFFSSAANNLKHLNFTRQDQQEKGSAETNENDPCTTANKEHDMFVGLDDVPGKCTF